MKKKSTAPFSMSSIFPKPKLSIYILIWSGVFFTLFLATHAAVSARDADPPMNHVEINGRLTNLKSLLLSIENVQNQILAIQITLQSPKAIGRETELRTQINKLINKKNEMEESFIRLCTDVTMDEVQSAKKSNLDWNMELKELLGPVIREVKKITSRPREIERLRNEIDLYNSRLPLLNKGLERITVFLKHTADPVLQDKLTSLKTDWQNRLQETNTRLNIASRQLEQRLEERKSFSESLQEVLQIFFKSRGRNFIVALISFLLSAVLFHYCFKIIKKYSPIHQPGKSFYSRFFDMFYVILTFFFSLLTLLAVLYFFGDWVLLSIAVIFLFGVGWASKQAIPIFWNQARLLLNIGPVREKEVIVYQGLPYRVVSINFFSKLENKALEGGKIRLPLKDLLAYRSRPKIKNEPWFPSRCGDWVRLKDGTHGKVVNQTPESVVLKLLGGARITYNSLDYIKQMPMNLSTGFRLWIAFGVDYDLQAEVTSEIPQRFKKEIIQALEDQQMGQYVEYLMVHFKAAAAYALEIEVIVDFNPQAGSEYDILYRSIQQACVRTCNRNNWKVPYQQVKVHMETGPDQPVEGNT